jgi:hypothetical protein
MKEVRKIASWYKNNFFIEPIEDNIIKVFKLNNGERECKK